MAINSNLTFVKDFIEDIARHCDECFKKTWSAENRVHYSSRYETLLDNDIVKDFMIIINPKFMRDFSAKEKEFIYEILRLVSIEVPDLRYLVDDLDRLFKQRSFQNERYFYLSHLTDNMFAYELDVRLTPKHEYRRTYYRKLHSKFGRKQLTLEEIFSQYFFCDFIEVNRKRAKKKVRHKGYRDHGSLGSEFSKTLRQQAGDISLMEAEAKRQKEKDDYLEFLRAFAGWE